MTFDYKEFFSRVTWVDLAVMAALLRGLYVGFRSGFFAEILRFASYLVTIGVTYHFYKQVGEYITLNSFLNETIARAVGFVALAVGVFLLAKLLVVLLKKMLKVGEGAFLSRTAGAAIGMCRWVVIMGLLFSFIDILPGAPLKKDIHERSVVGPRVCQVMPMMLDFMASISPQLSVSKK